jgi:hypothetical protein
MSEFAKKVTEFIQRGHPQEAIEEHRRLNYEFQKSVAEEFLQYGCLAETEEVLTCLSEFSIEDQDIKQLWNMLRHLQECERLGLSVFPLFIDFDTRWDKPHVLPDVTSDPSFIGWYAGKIESIDDDGVHTVLGYRDSKMFEAAYYRNTVHPDVFSRLSGEPVDSLVGGQHFEVYLFVDEDSDDLTKIALYRLS